MKEMILKFWKKWFGRETAGQVMNPVCHETKAAAPKAEKPSAPLPMLDRLEGYLFDRYDFRFNVLTEQAEYTPKGKDHYQLADQRTLNTFRGKGSGHQPLGQGREPTALLAEDSGLPPFHSLYG